jgi:TatD DNase family protein
MRLVDTHSHLHFSNFNDNRPEVYQRAAAAGVTRILCVGTTLEDSAVAINYAQSQDGVWAAVGVHPHEAEAVVNSQGPSLEEMGALLKEDKVVAVGEIGLDYYKSTTPKDIQEKALRLQLETGLETNLPFSFHVRDAWTDFWRVIDRYDGIKGVVHSFSSGRKQLDAALNRGLYVGLNGIMTFTRDEAQLEAAKLVPLNKLLLETDAPFLTPVPFRNETCEPKHTLDTAEFLAELRHEPLAKLAEQTTKNAIELFGL